MTPFSPIFLANVTPFPNEITRLTRDLASGLMVTRPFQADFEHGRIGPQLDTYLQSKTSVTTEDRTRMLRPIENMPLSRDAVGYLNEFMRSAGSPQAQRSHVLRETDFGKKSR